MPPVSPEAIRRAREYQAKWHAEDKRRYPIAFAMGNSMRTAKSRAKKSGMAFDLTPEWVRLQPECCVLSGIPFKRGAGKLSIYSPSIDRVNPHLGYTQSNCRYILAGINAMKGSDTDDDVLFVCRSILEVAS